MASNDNGESLNLSLQSDGLNLKSSDWNVNSQVQLLEDRLRNQETQMGALQMEIVKLHMRLADRNDFIQTQMVTEHVLRGQIESAENTLVNTKNTLVNTQSRIQELYHLLSTALLSVRQWQLRAVCAAFLIVVLAIGLYWNYSMAQIAEQERIKEAAKFKQKHETNLLFYDKSLSMCSVDKSNYATKIVELQGAITELQEALENLKINHSQLEIEFQHMETWLFFLTAKQTKFLYYENSRILDHALQIVQRSDRILGTGCLRSLLDIY